MNIRETVYSVFKAIHGQMSSSDTTAQFFSNSSISLKKRRKIHVPLARIIAHSKRIVSYSWR